MLFAEQEVNLIETFQDLSKKEIMLLSEEDETISVLSAIRNKKAWAMWNNSSDKADPPPDFYCDELKLMMEVMRVDDHSYKKKRKVANPTRAREHKIEKELKEKGILDLFPKAKLVINAKTDLPTKEDHNYNFYREDFKRTLLRHIKGIPNYRQNHPGYKLIFFVYDESSMYFQAEDKNASIDMPTKGIPHLHFWDKAFTSVFQNADIDYLIWYTPYKYAQVIGTQLILPKACVYKVGDTLFNERTYSVDYMISTER